MYFIIKMIILRNGDLELIPTNDIDYLIKLSKQYKYCKATGEQAKEVLNKYGYWFWNVYLDGERVGVIYICLVPKLGFTLDAYKDIESGVDTRYSYEAGKLVVDYVIKELTSVLWTAHDVRNRAATIVCKRMGFRKIKEVETALGKFVYMKLGE